MASETLQASPLPQHPFPHLGLSSSAGYLASSTCCDNPLFLAWRCSCGGVHGGCEGTGQTWANGPGPKGHQILFTMTAIGEGLPYFVMLGVSPRFPGAL